MAGITHIIETVTFDKDRRLVCFENRKELVYNVELTVRDDEDKKLLRLGVGEDSYFIRCTSTKGGEIRKHNKEIEKIEKTFNEIRKLPPLPEEVPEPEPEPEPEPQAEAIKKVNDWIDLGAIDIDEAEGTIKIGEDIYPANKVRIVLTTAAERKALSLITPSSHHTAYSVETYIGSVVDNNTRVNALSWKADAAAKRADRLQYIDDLKSGRFPAVPIPAACSAKPGATAIIVETSAEFQEPQTESSADTSTPGGFFRNLGDSLMMKKSKEKSRETMKTIDTGVLALTIDAIMFAGTVRTFTVMLHDIPQPVVDEKQMLLLLDQGPITLKGIDGEAWESALSALLQ